MKKLLIIIIGIGIVALILASLFFINNIKKEDVKDSQEKISQVFEKGLVKYELVGYEYIKPDGNYWDRISLVKNLKTIGNENVEGIVLVQMIENRKIKFEAFSGKTKDQVTDFTENVRIYER